MNEYFRPISGFEGLYEVNIKGEIRSLDREITVNGKKRAIRERVIKSRLGRGGYYTVVLSKGGRHFTKHIHRLLAEAFVKNSLNKPFVNHINGNKQDNRIENLEWVSHSENIRHAYRIGLSHVSNNRKIIDTCTGKIFSSIKEAAKCYYLNYNTCRNYLRGKRKNKTCLQYKV